jgi:polar amino acid transport system substrate-binding protein
MVTTNKRDLLKGIALAAGGATALAVTGVMGSTAAKAQNLDNGGLDPNSMLARVRASGKLTVGFGQTTLWLYRDLKTGELSGVYKDLLDDLARDLEVELEFKEVDFATSTVALRNGEYDLFGASLSYTAARALVVDFVGPVWSKGKIPIIHKDNADRFKTAADLNSPDVTFSQGAGSAEEARVRQLFPLANLISTSGQVNLAMEPVRAKRADVFLAGDIDTFIIQKQNDWVALVDSDHPIDRQPNTWAIRYGDPSWKSYLETWIKAATINGRVQRLVDQYVGEVLGQN